MLDVQRSDFRIDTVFPAIQTGAAVVTGAVVGHLANFNVSNFFVARIALVTSLLSAIANNIFKNVYAQYAAIPVLTAAVIAGNSLLYGANVIKSFAVKEFALITAVLLATKLIADHKDTLLSYVRKGEEKAKEVGKDLEGKVGKAVESVGKATESVGKDMQQNAVTTN